MIWPTVTVTILFINALQAKTTDMRFLNIGTMGVVMMISGAHVLWPGWQRRLYDKVASRLK